MTLSTAAIAALGRLDERPHTARMVFIGLAGEEIDSDEAQELCRAGYATLRDRQLTITDAGRARLKREQEWKKP